MSKKSRKKQKKVVYLQTKVTTSVPTWCGARINLKNYNRLWRWDTLEDVNL